MVVTPQEDPSFQPAEAGVVQEDDSPESKELPEYELVCHLDNIGESTLPLIHLFGVESFDLTEEQKNAIKQYVHRGGTILVETIGGQGTFSLSIERQVQELLQTPAIPLASTDPIISGRGLKGGYDNRRVRYRRFAVLDMAVRHRPRLAACFVKDRPTVIFSHEDLTLDTMGVPRWGIRGYTQQSATQLLTNLVLSARKQARQIRETDDG